MWELIRGRLSTAAAELDRPLITVETNLREIADKRRATWGRPHPTDFWGSRVAGSTLASAALVLQGSLRKLYVPGSYTYKELFPWSSHPLLDPLWSTSDLESVHDGCEAARLEKVGAISDWSGPLRHLRVCYLNSQDRYNCAKCEKCLRTLVALRLHGVRDKLDAFDKPLSLKRVRRLLMSDSPPGRSGSSCTARRWRPTIGRWPPPSPRPSTAGSRPAACSASRGTGSARRCRPRWPSGSTACRSGDGARSPTAPRSGRSLPR